MDALRTEIGKRNHRFFRQIKLKCRFFQRIDDVTALHDKQDCLLAMKRMQIVHSQLSQFAQDLLHLGAAVFSFSSCTQTLYTPSCLNHEQKAFSFQEAAKQLEENAYVVMDMIHDGVLQPLEHRIRELMDILDLIRKLDEQKCDYAYYKRLHVRSKCNRLSFESATRQKQQLDDAQKHCEHIHSQLRTSLQRIGGSFAYQNTFMQELVERLESILQEYCNTAIKIFSSIVLL